VLIFFFINCPEIAKKNRIFTIVIIHSQHYYIKLQFKTLMFVLFILVFTVGSGKKLKLFCFKIFKKGTRNLTKIQML